MMGKLSWDYCLPSPISHHNRSLTSKHNAPHPPFLLIALAVSVSSMFALLDAVSPASALSGEPRPRVGKLDTRGCLGKGYLVNGQPAISSLLFGGDEIEIKDNSCTLIVQYDINRTPKEETLVRSPHPYHVAHPSSKSSLDRIIDRIQMAFASTDPPANQLKGYTSGRGDEEVTVPLLDLWNSHIAAGTRTVHLAWREGNGPFDVIVSAKGKENEPLAKASNIQTHTIRFEKLNIQPGTYIVTVLGKDGRSAPTEFMAVDPSKIPTPPAELKANRSDSDLLQAGWLASRGHGEYVFEAYQRISALGESDKQVNRIREALERGWRPELE